MLGRTILLSKYNVDYLFKFLVIGNASTGKSCLLHQFIENKCKYTPLQAQLPLYSKFL